MNKIILGLLILFISSHSIADGYSQWGKIQELYFGAAGTYVRVTMNVSDSSTYCSISGKPYILMLDTSTETTRDSYKSRSAALLMAHAAGKDVRFYLVTGDCSNGEPKIWGLNIKG